MDSQLGSVDLDEPYINLGHQHFLLSQSLTGPEVVIRIFQFGVPIMGRNRFRPPATVTGLGLRLRPRRDAGQADAGRSATAGDHEPSTSVASGLPARISSLPD